jgi:hypothetical protein
MGWHRPTPDGGYKVEYVFADVDFRLFGGIGG